MRRDAKHRQSDDWSVFDDLPGDLMMWVLIVSELLVFGAALLVLLSVRIGDAAGFAADQQHLNRTAGAANTIILVTSGLFAALGVTARNNRNRHLARWWLFAASCLGVVFLAVKGVEYYGKAGDGIGIETSQFFMFYFLITGFHALHVIAGIFVLILVAWADATRNVEAGVAFWHLVDLIWVLLFPIIYLLR